MKKILFATILMTVLFANAENKNYFMKIQGPEALKDHWINQYADSDNSPQAYDVTLPLGYVLISADVESNSAGICSITRFDQKAQRLMIEALYLETDAGACVVTLSLFNKKDKKTIKAHYSIEQTGT